MSATNTGTSARAVDAPGQLSGNSLFARVPMELMMMIARPLTTPELCAFRVSCKAVEQALFPSFRHEFFRKKQFMIEDGSLQALLDISRHARLASALAHVIIDLDHVNFLHIARLPPREPPRDATQARPLAHGPHSLLSSGRAVQLLAEAFRNLARYNNPITVDLRDFDSRTRWRDGPGAVWRSYGAKALPRRPNIHKGRLRFAFMAFVVVLRALAAARVCPANLEVLFRDKFDGLGDYAFDMTEFADDEDDDDDDNEKPGATEQRPSVPNVLRSLEKLHLDVRLVRERYYGHSNAFAPSRCADEDAPAELYSMQLHDFVAAASNVRWLRLNFQRSPSELVDGYMRFFGRPAADLDAVLWPQQPDDPSPPPPLPERLLSSVPPFLERLDLGQAEMYHETLLNAVTRIPTLKALHLYVITFQRPRQQAEQDQWPSFLKALAAATAPAYDGGTATAPLAQLEQISVTNAAQLAGPYFRCSVWFDGKEYASYKGPRISEFLQKLSGSVAPPPSSSRMAPDVMGIYGTAATGSEDGSEDWSENDSYEEM